MTQTTMPSAQDIRELARVIVNTPVADIYAMGEAQPVGSRMRTVYFQMAAVVSRVRRPAPGGAENG